ESGGLYQMIGGPDRDLISARWHRAEGKLAKLIQLRRGRKIIAFQLNIAAGTIFSKKLARNLPLIIFGGNAHVNISSFSRINQLTPRGRLRSEPKCRRVCQTIKSQRRDDHLQQRGAVRYDFSTKNTLCVLN